MTFVILGVNADEVHLCGEEAVVDLIRNLSLDTGDLVEVNRYAVSFTRVIITRRY